MASKKSQSTREIRRSELQQREEAEIKSLLSELQKEHSTLARKVHREELAASITKKRVRRLASDTLIGCQLDERINHLFSAIRTPDRKASIDDVVRVIDGIIARIISRRIWIAIIAIITVTPAIISLVLLGMQNRTMIKKLEFQSAQQYERDRVELTDIVHANKSRWVGAGAQRRFENFNNHHHRVRSAAMMTIVSMQKQRWSDEEKQSLPPTKTVDLRHGEYVKFVIGGHLSLRPGETNTDFPRVMLDGSNLTMASIFNVWLDGSSFRRVQAKGARFWLPSAKHTDFSHMQAEHAHFAWDPKFCEPLHIEESRFDHAVLKNAQFDQVMMIRCSFVGTNFTGSKFHNTHFIDCDLTKAEFGNIDLTNNLNTMVRCLITKEQAKQIKLPSYCSTQPAEEKDTLRVTTNREAYEAAMNQE